MAYENPMDAMNPNYESPETIITNYESLNESIIDTSSVTIFWKGNEHVHHYSYNLDSTQWSGWSADTTVTLNNLNNGLRYVYFSSSIAGIIGIIISIFIFPKPALLGILIRKKS